MPVNKMNVLLDKIERHLGVKPLNLPDDLSKSVWAKDVIAVDSLDTFSRYFPNSMRITLDVSQMKMNKWFVIDEYIPDNIEILGVRDIDWTNFSATNFGTYDIIGGTYSIDDIASLQMRADHMSLFNYQFFVNFMPPNQVKISTNSGTLSDNAIYKVPIEIFIKHATNLMTIPPTMMETFEKLAEADVARFLYENLKYYEGLETVYANIDMKLSDLQDKASKREEIEQLLDESHVSAANKNQPLMFVI